MDLLDALDRYYQERGIAAIGCRCPRADDCGRKMRITDPKEAYVGERFGKGGLPRLVFLSLDPGEEHKDPERRTLRWQQTHTPSWSTEEKLRRNKSGHWWQTLKLARLLLEPWDPSLTEDSVVSCIAHTNSAKCWERKPQGRGQSARHLFDNCRGFVLGELNLLAPHVLVTQGKYAWDVVKNLPPVEVLLVEPKAPLAHADARIVDLPPGSRTVVLRTSHPRARGFFSEKKAGLWQEYRRVVEQRRFPGATHLEGQLPGS